MDDVSVNVGQATFKAVVVETKPLVIETHEMKNSGVEVIDTDAILNCLEAEIVAFAMTVSGLYPCSRKKTGKGIGVMITSGAVAL